MTSPMDSSGQMTSTCMTGSRSLGPHLAMPSRNARARGDLERHHGGIDVVGAVEERRLDVDDGKPR